MPAQLILLGEPRFVTEVGELVRIPPKAFGLAAVLALGKTPAVSRSAMAELLWGTTDRRHGNLRKMLWDTRAAVRGTGTDLFSGTTVDIRLSLSNLVVDVIQLLALLDHRHSRALDDVCGLYRGDLLESLSIDSGEFGEWLCVQRAKLRDRVLTVMAGRLDTQDRESDREECRAAAKRVLEIDAYNESACRALMRIHANLGESAQLHATYRALTQRLADDLSTSPAAATTHLYRQLVAAGSEEVENGQSPVTDQTRAGRASRATSLPKPDAGGIPSLSVTGPRGASVVPAGRHAVSIVDDVMLALWRSKTLRVLAPDSAWPGVDALAAVRPACCADDYVLDTAIAQIGQEARLTLRLVQSSSRLILWTHQAAIGEADRRAWSDEMTAFTAAALRDQIERAELAGLEPDHFPSAYHWFLYGERCLKVVELPSIRRGRRALRTAHDLHPTFAPAVAALALSCGLEWLLLARGDPETLEEALSLGQTAVEIDPQDWSGHRAVGFARLYQKSYDASFAAYETAVRLNPYHPDLLAQYANFLSHYGELDRAKQVIEKAIRLNPVLPDYYRWVAASNHYMSGECHAAIEMATAMRKPSATYRLVACCHARLGNREMARRFVTKVKEIHPDFSIDRWLRLVPIRAEPLAAYYAEGLRLAGFD